MENHIEVEEKKQDKGFTLVELLIVIVILGILATVTVFAVTGITNKGKTSACQADAKTILRTGEFRIEFEDLAERIRGLGVAT